MEFNDLNILLNGPLCFADVWVKMVVPPLSALFADATWQTLGYLGPVARSVLCDEFDEYLVLR